jgi:Dolichyl-phosphate-mannose-protein mannosyltransferase
MVAKILAFRPQRCSVYDLLAAGGAFGLLLVVFATFRDYGVAFDEGVQDQYGTYVLDWYASLGANRQALTYEDLLYYGGAFDLLAALLQHISPFGHFETRHLLNAVVGVLGIVGCWRLGRHLGGPAVGVASAVLLALMPSWYGMMFINPKDIPFAAGYIWSVYYILRVSERLPEAPSGLVIRLGIVIGLTLGIRIGGLLVVAYLGAQLLLFVICEPGMRPVDRLRRMLRLCVSILLPTVLIAWTGMLSAWPFAQVDPIGNPLAALRHFAEYSPGIETLFFGQVADDVHRPLLYLPIYLLIKIPEIDGALIAASAVFCAMSVWRERLMAFSSGEALLALAVLAPLAYVAFSRPELYDAERHFLFLLPPLAIACALAARRIVVHLGRTGGTIAAAAIAVACGASAAPAMRDLHPYEYAYFNRLVGGLPGAADRFETEYWGSALTEAARMLSVRLRSDANHHPVRVAICGNDTSVEDPLRSVALLTDDRQSADYYIATSRGHCDDEVAGKTIAVVGRDGVAFAVVKDLHHATERVAAMQPMANQTLSKPTQGARLRPVHRSLYSPPQWRSVAQPGSALDWGSRGRRFESGRSDHRHSGYLPMPVRRAAHVIANMQRQTISPPVLARKTASLHSIRADRVSNDRDRASEGAPKRRSKQSSVARAS